MSISPQLQRLVYPVLLVASVTFIAWLVRGMFTLANVTMVYILVVLILAIQRGTRVALVAAFVCFLCINFFLVQPYYTFLVADPRDVLELLVFFIVAALGGQLAANARQQAEVARQRAREQEILYRLTRTFNQLSTREGIEQALVQMLKTDLHALHAQVLPAGVPPAAYAPAAQLLPLHSDDHNYGTLSVTFALPPTPEQQRLLTICVSQAAMALNRIELAERARLSARFEEADRLKTALLRAVSHDLRTPLTVIKSSANNLHMLSEQMSPRERAELSETIEQEADLLNRLVGNLLEMSRLQAGALTLDRELNSLEEVAGDVAAQVFQRSGQQRVVLEMPDDLPLVSFDYGLITQALANLVENALRYEPPDRQIQLVGAAGSDEVCLSVINHGETIPADERERIMEPFYHGSGGNTGLGLAIAKGIVEAHHGSLQVQDTPGGGATFIIALPLHEEKTDVA